LFNSQLITLKSFVIGLEPAQQFPWQQNRLDGLSKTRSSSIAERPRDASCHWIFC